MLWKLLLAILGDVLPFRKPKDDTLEEEVEEASREVGEREKKETEERYEKTKGPILKKGEELKKKYGGAGGTFFSNLKNVALNAVDNTLGYPIALYQNAKTRRELAKDPSKTVVYRMNGFAQNRGAQWRWARDIRKRGALPYHVKVKHSLPDDRIKDNTYGQMRGLHEYAVDRRGRKSDYKPSSSPEENEKRKKSEVDRHMKSRSDKFVGHSSGGDVGIYLAADSRTSKHGVGEVYSIAPAPTGIEASTIGQRLLLPFATKDNAKTIKGKKLAIKKSKQTPVVSHYTLMGEKDNLVRMQDAINPVTHGHYVIRGKHSTHFGTSGPNKHANKDVNDVIFADKKDDPYRPEGTRRPPNVYKLDVTGREQYNPKEGPKKKAA